MLYPCYNTVGGSGGGGTGTYLTVSNYASLPAASTVPNATYLVLSGQGVYFVNYKAPGLYTSDGANWSYQGPIAENLFVDNIATFEDNADTTKKMMFDLSTETTGETVTLQIPPTSGMIALCSQSGKNKLPWVGTTTLTAGQTSGTVSAAFGFTPSVVRADVLVPSGQGAIQANVVAGTITSTGFNFTLTGPPGNNSYILQITAYA